MTYNTYIRQYTYDNTYSVAKVNYRGSAAPKNYLMRPSELALSIDLLLILNIEDEPSNVDDHVPNPFNFRLK